MRPRIIPQDFVFSSIVVLVVLLVLVFATSPFYTMAIRLFHSTPQPELVGISFAPEARVPMRSGSRGDGDYDRWRRAANRTDDRR